VSPCCSRKNRRFGELKLVVITNVVASPVIVPTLKIEARCSSETSVLRRSTRRHIPEGGTHQSNRWFSFSAAQSTCQRFHRTRRLRAVWQFSRYVAPVLVTALHISLAPNIAPHHCNITYILFEMNCGALQQRTHQLVRVPRH
jgi:hypothetical protein